MLVEEIRTNFIISLISNPMSHIHDAPAINPLSPPAQIMDLGKRILGQSAFDQLMKLTFYGQFVAGEDHIAIRPLIQKNRAFGVGSVLDYSVEEDISEEEEKGQKETEYENCGIAHLQYVSLDC